MRYRVLRRVIIKTENAAKPASQQSNFLVSLIKSLEPVDKSFDFGSGKLRYTKEILRKTNLLTMVDSEIQISRKQKLRGVRTSIRKVFMTSNQIEVMNLKEFLDYADYFDRGFCVNVLSVVPILSIRHRIIGRIFNALRTGGTCLFVIQYRNSDFSRMAKMANARIWRKGILINSLRGHSYYGIITPNELTSMLRKCGFQIVRSVLNEGSIYVMAMRPSG